MKHSIKRFESLDLKKMLKSRLRHETRNASPIPFLPASKEIDGAKMTD